MCHSEFIFKRSERNKNEFLFPSECRKYTNISESRKASKPSEILKQVQDDTKILTNKKTTYSKIGIVADIALFLHLFSAIRVKVCFLICISQSPTLKVIYRSTLVIMRISRHNIKTGWGLD
ncbi:MAG: hypothetical protein US16_C0019G0003 [Candidatus Moranbacteria bacterium GW2011_GWE2_36_40]|nr:MAG: hypothetical protein US16_C0019G0003 [Candidatus Moranbacteria bacterium GW2011_GWE2_36_40]